MANRNNRRVWGEAMVKDFRANANYWKQQFGSASILGSQLLITLDRMELLEKWLRDEGYPECDFCYELAPTEQKGDLRICQNCRESENEIIKEHKIQKQN